jgi:nucleotide-binding universal stress UspA family protein
MISKDGETRCTSKDKSILIAVDGSENAKRAVMYVAEFLRGLPGYCITLLNIISEPPADYFTGREERQAWEEEQGAKAEKMIAEYRGILIQSGFAEDSINAVAALQDLPSVAECILSHLQELKSSTVVVGRRGITRKEEFLFGSTSSKILREAKDCSIWVIQ